MPKLTAPPNGVTVRMYRHGHGDCFLLAFPKASGSDPSYVLIDCGLKPGSQKFLTNTPIGDVVKHIGESTGFKIDLMIVTHEHQDHVNGIWKRVNPYFEDFEIRNAWFAWTEDPTDDLAKVLRERHRDQLLGLVSARKRLTLAASEYDPALMRLDGLLALEMGEGDDSFDTILAASGDPERSINKQAMRFVKDKAAANGGVRYLSPGGEPVPVPETDGVRAFVLGPPRSEDLLTDEDPVGSEEFHVGGQGFSFSAAVSDDGQGRSPFSGRFAIRPDEDTLGFIRQHYGEGEDLRDVGDLEEVPDDAGWRRIDQEWLYSAETLALKLNRGVNNTSLVLAFELPGSKKILLFGGDAQRGNWISWDDHVWLDGCTEITARDILARTVLYKTPHHASHNGTLNGTIQDDYPNLSWMGLGSAAGEFTAMITAVNEWAMTKNNPPWRHPFPPIRAALDAKAQGRVFQTDEDAPTKPADVSDTDWNKFLARTVLESLFFDYQVFDE